MADGRQVDVSSLIEQPSRSRLQFWVLVSSLALMFVEGYDLQIMAFAAPAIIRDWHISKQMFGPVLSASLVGYLAGALLVSVCSDYFGRKVIIIAATFVFGAFTLVTAFATSLPELLILRLIAGVGLGGMVPAVIALNTEYVPTRRRGTRISLLFVGFGGGAALCGFLPWLGWPRLFEIGGGLALVFGLVAAVALPESLRFLIARKAAPSRIAAILKRMRPEGPLNNNDRFVLLEEGHDGVPVGLLFSEGHAGMTVLLWAAFIFSLLSNYSLVNWLPTVLVSGGLPMHEAKIAGGFLMLGGLLGTVLIGPVLDRKGIKALAFAFMLSAPFIVAISFARLSEALLLVTVFLAGGTLLGGQAGLVALAGTLYPTFARSTGVGWALGIGRFGAIAGPIIGGFMLSANMSMSWLFTWAALPPIACAGALFLIMRMRRNASRTRTAALAPVPANQT